jgi:hypothetical protein
MYETYGYEDFCTLVALALLLNQIVADRRGKRRGWIPWLFVHLVWLNLHAGFVVGLGILGLHALEQGLRRKPCRHLWLLIAASMLLIVANPWGVEYYRYLARALTLPRPAIEEWLPVTRAWPVIGAFYGLSLLLILYAVLRRGFASLPGLPLVLVAALAGGLHQRHLSIHALVWAVHVPAWIEATPLGAALREGLGRRPKRVRGIALALAAGIAVLLATRPIFRIAMPAHAGEHPRLLYPIGAVGWLEESGFAGNLFVPFSAGGYVSWRLYPRVKVSLDGRYEVAYPPDWLDRVHEIYAAQGDWSEGLDAIATDAVLARRGKPLLEALELDPGWGRAYLDDDWEIWIRGAPALVVDRRGRELSRAFPD